MMNYYGIRQRKEKLNQKIIKNYLLMGTILFLFSLTILAYHHSKAEALPCINSCNVEITKKLSTTTDTTIDVSLYVSITRSSACKISNCISNSYLVKNYDTSDQSISGKFVLKNGDLVRKKAFFGKSLDIYKSAKW